MSSRNFNIFMCLFGTAFALLLGGCSDTTAPNDPIAAETLAIVPIEGNMGAHTVDNSLTFTLKIGGPATDLLLNGVALFGQQLLKNGDKGRTLVATAATEPGFNRFVSFLTNGTSDRVGYYFSSSGGGGGTELPAESSFFSGRSGSGVDFAGYTITSLEFHIDSISVVTPGSDPGKDGVWTDFYLSGNLVVLGYPN